MEDTRLTDRIQNNRFLFHHSSKMPSIPDLLGPKLIGAEGSEVDTESLVSDGAIIGLYFSAAWCPPCRGFTPKLVQFFNKCKQPDSGRNLTIVFVSSDRDETTFADYFKEMPWLALPFEERDRKVGSSFLTDLYLFC